MTLLGNNGRSPLGDGLYGLQAWHGVDVIQGSHHCAKQSCKRPAQVAVFGKVAPDSGRVARLNTCRMHVEGIFLELFDSWICALLGDRGEDYCPHCAVRKVGPQGQGHLRHCPIGLTSRAFAAAARLPWEAHDAHSCDPCASYHERKPGPTG